MVFDLLFLALMVVFTFAVVGSVWLYRDIRGSRKQENPEEVAWEQYLEGQIAREEYERVAHAQGMTVERLTLEDGVGRRKTRGAA